MNRIKTIFTNRKFSLDGLIDVICTISGLVGLTVAIVGFGWLVSTYPAETGAAVVCIVTVVLVCLVLAGIFNTVFPKNDDLEIDKWIERAKKELENQHIGENAAPKKFIKSVLKDFWNSLIDKYGKKPEQEQGYEPTAEELAKMDMTLEEWRAQNLNNIYTPKTTEDLK